MGCDGRRQTLTSLPRGGDSFSMSTSWCVTPPEGRATSNRQIHPPVAEASEVHMSGEQALERSVLERKERDQLQTIAEALGVKPGSRTKKADLISQILVAAGVEAAPENGAATAE